jgi:hypothetical protein
VHSQLRDIILIKVTFIQIFILINQHKKHGIWIYILYYSQCLQNINTSLNKLLLLTYYCCYYVGCRIDEILQTRIDEILQTRIDEILQTRIDEILQTRITKHGYGRTHTSGKVTR